MPALPDDLSWTLGRLYETFWSAEGRRSGLDALRDYVGAEHVVFSTYGRDSVECRTCGNIRSDDERRMILGVSSRQDFRDFMTSLLPPETIVRQTALLGIEAMRRSDAYQQFLRPLDGGLGALVYWRDPDDWTGVSFCRSLERGDDFRPEELDRLQDLVPHMMAAHRLSRRLADAERTVSAANGALDALSLGMIVLDRAGRPLFVNRRAAEVLDARDGLILDAAGLRCLAPEATQALQAVIRTVAALELEPGSGDDAGWRGRGPVRTRVSAPRTPPSPPLAVTAVPAGPLKGAAFAEDRGSVVLLIHDPDLDPPIREADLMALYGLTRREAQLAARIAGGDTLADAAERLGVVSGTARQYLKCVFDKVGVQRQSELVRRLLRACR